MKLPHSMTRCSLLLFGILLAADHALLAADRSKSKPPKPGQFNANQESVELFAAIEAQQISVKVIAKDSTQANVLVRNLTDKPLNVRMPEAFAAMPVLAQVGGLGGGQGLGGGGQGLGGGIGGGLGGGGAGGGFFNVPAEKTGKLKVACVCLEHGKPEPRRAMIYELRPLESLNSDPAVRELCRSLGADSISQRAAQVAAWRLANGMTFEQLRDKEIVHLDGRRESYFTVDELLGGMGLAAQALARSAAAGSKSEVSQSRADESALVSPAVFVLE